MLRNPLKRQVREALMEEQGHLCAYCMRRIPDSRILDSDVDLSNVYIEHWKARSAEQISGKNLGLDYKNLLAVCSGNEKAPERQGKHKKRFITCDKKRDHAPLTVNPTDPVTLRTIYYKSNGEIHAEDPVIENDLVVRLNLNCNSEAVTLPNSRKAVLDAIQEAVVTQGGDLRQNCLEQLALWESETDPKTPYIGIVIWWLKEQLKQLPE